MAGKNNIVVKVTGKESKMRNFCELVSADMAVGMTYAAVEDKVEELLQKCNDKIVEAAEDGLRGTSVNFSEYSHNVGSFAVEQLKSKGFKTGIEVGSSARYITMLW